MNQFRCSSRKFRYALLAMLLAAAALVASPAAAGPPEDLQVSIEVRFITVHEHFFEKLGVNFDFRINDRPPHKPGNFPPSGNDQNGNGLPDDVDQWLNRDANGNGIPDWLEPGFRPQSPIGPAVGAPPAEPSLGVNVGSALLSDIEIFLLLQAATGDARTNILPAPKVTLFNGDSAPIDNSDKRDPVNPVKTEFQITPSITTDGQLRLEIVPSSSVDGGAATAGGPSLIDAVVNLIRWALIDQWRAPHRDQPRVSVNVKGVTVEGDRIELDVQPTFGGGFGGSGIGTTNGDLMQADFDELIRLIQSTLSPDGRPIPAPRSNELSASGVPIFRGGGFGETPYEGAIQADFDALIDLIQGTLSPERSETVDGGEAWPFDTPLGLTAWPTQRVHQEISDLLEQLRQLQDLQVTVEVRFITLEDTFFERVGVDFDIDDTTGDPPPPLRFPPTKNDNDGNGLADDVDDNFRRDANGNGIPDWLEPLIGPTPDPDSIGGDSDHGVGQGPSDGSAPVFGGFDPTSGISVGSAILSDIETFFFIQAAQGDSRSNVVQAPKVSLFNGQNESVDAQGGDVVLIPVVSGDGSLKLIKSSLGVGSGGSSESSNTPRITSSAGSPPPGPPLPGSPPGGRGSDDIVMAGMTLGMNWPVTPIDHQSMMTMAYREGPPIVVGPPPAPLPIGEFERLMKLLRDAKPMIIVAEDMDGEALATLVVNKLRGTAETSDDKTDRQDAIDKSDEPSVVDANHPDTDGDGDADDSAKPGGKRIPQSPLLGTLPLLQNLFVPPNNVVAALPIQVPEIKIVSANTTVEVPNGGTLLLGGLKFDHDEAETPNLDNLPYINRLFKNAGVGGQETNLILLVTPRIIIQEGDDDDTRDASSPPPQSEIADQNASSTDSDDDRILIISRIIDPLKLRSPMGPVLPRPESDVGIEFGRDADGNWCVQFGPKEPLSGDVPDYGPETGLQFSRDADGNWRIELGPPLPPWWLSEPPTDPSTSGGITNRLDLLEQWALERIEASPEFQQPAMSAFDSQRRGRDRVEQIFYVREGLELHRLAMIQQFEKDLAAEPFAPAVHQVLRGALRDLAEGRRNVAPKVLRSSESGPRRPIVVAVVDSGIDLTHPDLWGQLWRNRGEIPHNGLDDDRNGYIDDVYGYNTQANNADLSDDLGHGTHVAGVIAARRDGRGVVGVHPGVKLMILKAADSWGRTDSARVALAIRYAVNNGADIINISAESSAPPTELDQAMVAWAASRGVLVVAAAGSKGRDTAKVAPAGLRGVLTVGASDRHDRRAGFSGWGGAVDLVAPGVDILGLRAAGTDAMFTLAGGDPRFTPAAAIVDDRWYRAEGTSFAAPLVTGAAALIWERNPNLTPRQVTNKLLMGCDDIEQSGWDRLSGSGRLNIAKALAADADHFLQTRITATTLRHLYGRPTLEVSGTAVGTHLSRRRLQMAHGSQPDDDDWITVDIRQLDVEEGVLGYLPGKRLDRVGVWTVRSVVEDTLGTVRTSTAVFELR